MTRNAPLPEEEIQLSASKIDAPEREVPVDVGAVPAPNPADYEPNPPAPLPELRTLDLPASPVTMQVLGEKPYRRVFILTSPRDAALIEASYQETFMPGEYAALGVAGLEIRVYPHQRLYLRQSAAVPLQISFHVHPDLQTSALALPAGSEDET